MAEAPGGRGIMRDLVLADTAFTKPVNTVKIEIEGYEDLIFSIENKNAQPEQPAKKSAPEIESLKFLAKDYYMPAPDRFEVAFKDAASDDVANYIKDGDFTLKVNDVEYNKAERFGRNSTRTYVIGEDNNIQKLYLSTDGFNQSANIISITKEGYEDLKFTFERGYEVNSFKVVGSGNSKYFEVGFGDIERKELEAYLKDKSKTKITVNGVLYSAERFDRLAPMKNKFNYITDSTYGSPKAIRISAVDVDLSSVEITISVEGYKDIIYHYSGNDTDSNNSDTFEDLTIEP